MRWVDIDPADCTLDLASLEAALAGRPRLVAVGMASNATGTINPVRDIVRRAHAAGAWTFIDAVHYAPHGPIDVDALETDFLACSVYKFFGPHLGRPLRPPRAAGRAGEVPVRPAPDAFETGTQNHEGMAAAIEAIEYLAEIGRGAGSGYRGALSVDERPAPRSPRGDGRHRERTSGRSASGSSRACSTSRGVTVCGHHRSRSHG